MYPFLHIRRRGETLKVRAKPTFLSIYLESRRPWIKDRAISSPHQQSSGNQASEQEILALLKLDIIVV